jgi:hypothetical protein
MGLVGWAGDRYHRPYMKEIDTREIVGAAARHLEAVDFRPAEAAMTCGGH